LARSHFWARRFDGRSPELRDLSKEGRDGFEYARALALSALERRHAGIHGGPMPERLRASDLAERDFTSAAAVNTKIKQARIELFGRDLSESGMYHRLRRRDQLRKRHCAEPDCDTLLDPQASASRRYCDHHRTGAARARRHRRQDLLTAPALPMEAEASATAD
jgi:hypothetical protein